MLISTQPVTARVASAPTSPVHITRTSGEQSLEAIDFSNERFWLDAHPDVGYHTKEHSRVVASVAYKFANRFQHEDNYCGPLAYLYKRNLFSSAEDFLNFIFYVGLLHDFHPARPLGTAPKVINTLEISTSDFNYENTGISLDGLRRSFLRGELHFSEFKKHLADIMWVRTSYPFGEESRWMYVKKLTDFILYLKREEKIEDQKVVELTVLAMKLGAEFSEYPDKLAYALVLEDFEEYLNRIQGLIDEMNRGMGLPVDIFSLYSYGFLNNIGTECPSFIEPDVKALEELEICPPEDLRSRILKREDFFNLLPETRLNYETHLEGFRVFDSEAEKIVRQYGFFNGRKDDGKPILSRVCAGGGIYNVAKEKAIQAANGFRANGNPSVVQD